MKLIPTTLVTLASIGGAFAAKGKAEVFGCVHLGTQPKPFTVNITPGSSIDQCMAQSGNSVSMEVTTAGVTCKSIGMVEVECFWSGSYWSLSYEVPGHSGWSGSTYSRWQTGPFSSDIQLKDFSPGTVVCPSKALCPVTYQNWPNNNNAKLYDNPTKVVLCLRTQSKSAGEEIIMSQAGQYQGSQAFNHIDPSLKESVNPNTGSLFVSLPIVKMLGKRSSIDLTVNIFYSAGFRGTFGLPPNWGLDLPYVLQDKSVTVNGRTYPIDEEWSDIEGHKSGLRYMNNHGIRFERVVPPQPLPSGLIGAYGYTLEHVNGSVDYFDAFGKPIEHHDIYGNFIHYSYIDGQEEGVDSPYVKIGEIRDSWGQEIQISFMESSEMRVSLPDGGETVLRFTATNLYTIIDASGYQTDIEYTDFNESSEVLSRITYPSGLISQYDYVAVQYLDLEGKGGWMPAVQDVRSLDKNNKVYQHTRYSYGMESGATYTGAAIECRMGGPTDALMDDNVRGLNYRYDVVTSKLDENEKAISRTLTWYDNFHLPVEEYQYLLNNEGEFVEAQKTLLTYSTGNERTPRITSYNLPIRSDVFRNTSNPTGVPAWQLMSRTDTQYNGYGNILESTEYLFGEDGASSKQKSVKTEYIKTSKGVQLPHKNWTIDFVDGTTEYEEKGPSLDGRDIGTVTTWYQDSQSGPFKSWRTMTMEYDGQGRLIVQRKAWSSDSGKVEGTLDAVTTRVEFAAELQNGILVRSDVDGCGNKTVVHQDMRQMNGPEIKKILPGGQTEIFEYDRDGRIIKRTNALGESTTLSYKYADLGLIKVSEEVNGYRTKTSFDVLGREVEVADNGDPTTSFTDDPSRVLSHKSYNWLGLEASSTDKLGLRTVFSYDSLKRPIATVDAHQNTVTHEYDNGGRTMTQKLNGDTRMVVHMDGLLRPIREIKFPDSGDHLSELTSLIGVVQYNGRGQEIRRSLSETKKSDAGVGPSIFLESEQTRYGPNKVILSKTHEGAVDNGVDTVKREYGVDLFDNYATYTKTTTYADGRSFQHQGSTRIYNEINKLSVFRNQEGQEEHLSYDVNGWQQSIVRLDGSQVTYTYDDLGRTVKTTYPSGAATENTFGTGGELLQIREGDTLVKHSYSLDGTLLTTTYNDGRQQSVKLDNFSRVIVEKDSMGVEKEISYDEFGSVIQRTCEGDVVTFLYGEANHSRGEYIGNKIRGKCDQDTAVSYDGFGRIRQKTYKNPNGTIVLDTVYTTDGRDKIVSVKSESALFKEQNTERILSYDGIGQIIQDVQISTEIEGGKSVTKYQYDGNSNVLKTETDGQVVSRTYNTLDQCTNNGFSYDANGNLTQDDQAQTYLFDERNRLVSVSLPSEDPTAFSYHCNDHLAQRRLKSGSEQDRFYYDDNAGKINAIFSEHKNDNGQQEEVKTSLLSDSDSILGGYTDKGAASYFLKEIDNTAVVMDSKSHMSAKYTAYGARKTSHAPTNILSEFGFSQAFTDSRSNLVYLGSRFYSPGLKSFLSLDTYDTENRYAYCSGDPINRIDPTGHSWIVDTIATLVGVGVAVGVGALVTALTGGSAFPMVAAVAAGALGGALGNAATLGVQYLGGKEVTGSDFAWSIASGALIGGLSAGLARYSQYTAKGDFLKAIKGGAIVGATTSALKETSAMIHKGQFDVKTLFVSTLQGAVLGAASGYWARRTYIRGQAELQTRFKDLQSPPMEMTRQQYYAMGSR
ncbi:tRNA3(Ser)-specific nuclease WapA [Paramyrothecium foliicola]|nr:tRNA3(Ser)-specific nuclease WapA [Paramyrothecium foliicola]